MTWQTLKEYAEAQGQKRGTVMLNIHRKKFPADCIQRIEVEGRCVLIQVKNGTPWPVRSYSHKKA